MRNLITIGLLLVFSCTFETTVIVPSERDSGAIRETTIDSNEPEIETSILDSGIDSGIDIEIDAGTPIDTALPVDARQSVRCRTYAGDVYECGDGVLSTMIGGLGTIGWALETGVYYCTWKDFMLPATCPTGAACTVQTRSGVTSSGICL